MPMCINRPNYPFSDQLPGVVGQHARHHLIPWRDVCVVGRDYIDGDEQRMAAFFNHFNEVALQDANLGEWGGTNQDKRIEGADGLIREVLQGNAAAEEEFCGLISWLPGNLVIGPTNRPNHAGTGATSFK